MKDMGSKAWACILAITFPFVLYAYIGIHGRTQFLGFERVEYGSVVAERIYAFGPYLLEADRTSVGAPAEFESRLIASSEHWIDASDRGVLTDILPASLDDQSDSGVKAEIWSCRDRLLRSLRKLASNAWDTGETDRAIRLTTTALRLSDVAKYSDVYSITRLTLVQRDLIIETRSHADQLSPNQVAQIEDVIRKMRDPKAPTNRLIAHIELLHVRESGVTQSDRSLRGVLVAAKSVSEADTARELTAWAKARPFSQELASISTQLALMYKSQGQLSDAQSDLSATLLAKSQQTVLAAADRQS